jgi:hypothetical protein
MDYLCLSKIQSFHISRIGVLQLKIGRFKVFNTCISVLNFSISFVKQFNAIDLRSIIDGNSRDVTKFLVS